MTYSIEQFFIDQKEILTILKEMGSPATHSEKKSRRVKMNYNEVYHLSTGLVSALGLFNKKGGTEKTLLTTEVLKNQIRQTSEKILNELEDFSSGNISSIREKLKQLSGLKDDQVISQEDVLEQIETQYNLYLTIQLSTFSEHGSFKPRCSSQIERLLQRASEYVEKATNNKLTAEDLSEYYIDHLNLVKAASTKKDTVIFKLPPILITQSLGNWLNKDEPNATKGPLLAANYQPMLPTLTMSSEWLGSTPQGMSRGNSPIGNLSMSPASTPIPVVPNRQLSSLTSCDLSHNPLGNCSVTNTSIIVPVSSSVSVEPSSTVMSNGTNDFDVKETTDFPFLLSEQSSTAPAVSTVLDGSQTTNPADYSFLDKSLDEFFAASAVSTVLDGSQTTNPNTTHQFSVDQPPDFSGGAMGSASTVTGHYVGASVPTRYDFDTSFLSQGSVLPANTTVDAKLAPRAFFENQGCQYLFESNASSLQGVQGITPPLFLGSDQINGHASAAYIMGMSSGKGDLSHPDTSSKSDFPSSTSVRKRSHASNNEVLPGNKKGLFFTAHSEPTTPSDAQEDQKRGFSNA